MHPGVYIGLGAALLLFVFTQGGKEGYSRAMLVGDSHSSRSWAVGGQLAQRLVDAGIPTHVEAHGGRDTSWFLRSDTLADGLAESHPDLLVVLMGTNDSRMGMRDPAHSRSGHRLRPFPQREASYRAYLAQFVEIAKAAGVKHIIWFGPSKMEGNHAFLMEPALQVERWQQEVLEPLGVEWHSSMALTSDLPNSDGIHFDQAEYGVWANRAAELIFDDVEAA